MAVDIKRLRERGDESETDADVCMQLILNLEAQVMFGQKEMLRHLHQLHALRDREIHFELQFLCGSDSQLSSAIEAMQ